MRQNRSGFIIRGTMTDIKTLIAPDRVHRRIYTDPDIFDLEMKQIFSKAWIYVGHESQVADPGDYYCTRIGQQSVVMTRDADGTIHVIYNRCGHRGALVVSAEAGHAEDFRCCYHGWRYGLDGSLLSVPKGQGYRQGCVQPGDPTFAMASVPRTDSYRGFVFSSLAEDGPPLVDFLGYMTTSFDDLADRAPDGEIEVAGGIARHAYRGNWKLIFENLNDGLHPMCVHQSSIEAAQEQDDDAPTDGAGEIAVRQMRQNGAPWSFWEDRVGLWAYPYGHSFLGDYHDDEKLVAGAGDPAFAEYRTAMENKFGPDRAREILGVMRWNTNIYPSVSFMSQFRQLRVIQPVSVDRTEVLGFCFRLKGAPEKMFHDTIRFANVTNAAASPVLTDDLETYSRLRRGLEMDGSDWVPVSRGLGRDIPDAHGGRQAENGLSELHIRNMFEAWSGYMSDEGTAR